MIIKTNDTYYEVQQWQRGDMSRREGWYSISAPHQHKMGALEEAASLKTGGVSRIRVAKVTHEMAID